MQKLVLNVDVHDDRKCKQRVMRIATSVQGVNDISLDVNNKKLTLIGTMDMVDVVNKLRKVYYTTVDTIGPAEEPQKPKESEKPNEPDNKPNEPKVVEGHPYVVYVDYPWQWCYSY